MYRVYALLSVLLLLASCASPIQRIHVDEEVPEERLAKIVVSSSSESDKSTRIVRVGDVTVDADDGYLLLPPGIHILHFTFKQVLPSTSSVRMTLQLGNQKRDLVGEGPKVVENSSYQAIQVAVIVGAGDTYYIDSSQMEWKPVGIMVPGRYSSFTI